MELDGRHSKGSPVKTGLFPALLEGGIYRNLQERKAIEIGEWRDGWLYFTAPAGEAVDLFRMRLSEKDLHVSGTAQRITFGTGNVKTPRFGPGGRIVFARTDVSYDLYSLDAQGAVKKLTAENGLSLRASINRTGRYGVWEKRPSASQGQAWFFDLASGASRKLG